MSQNEELFRASVPEGTHLGPSRMSNGAYRGMLFDNTTNALKGQAELFRVDSADDSGDEDDGNPYGSPLLAAVLGVAAGVLGTIVVVKQAPRIKSWWLEAALPGLRWRWDRLTGQKDDAVASTEVAPAVQTSNFSHEIALAVEDQRSIMSSSEAKQRFLVMLLAAALVAEQVRLLQDVRIQDDVQLRALRSGMETLTTGQIAELTNQMLEADETLLDETTRSVFLSVFGGGAWVDGRYAPIPLAKIKTALQLPDSEATPH